jgi:dTDP-4-dehydrorhamnose 3,5-epimerase
MEFNRTEIPEVIVVNPQVHEDTRGFFMETYRADQFASAGIDTNFVQDNHSRSIQYTLRGLHYQIRHAQGKLVQVVVGEIFDVAVDLRRSSPTIGRWVGILLSAQNKHQLWVPKGFAHGFYVTSEWAEVIYKTTDYYNRESERCIRWDDPTIGVTWPFVNGITPILSPKDQSGKSFREAELFE